MLRPPEVLPRDPREEPPAEEPGTPAAPPPSAPSVPPPAPSEVPELPEEPAPAPRPRPATPLIDQIAEASRGAGGTFQQYGSIGAAPSRMADFTRPGLDQAIEDVPDRGPGAPVGAPGAGEMDDAQRAYRLARMARMGRQRF